MSHQKIYIAGKVSGLPLHEVIMKFGAAQKALESVGHTAVNPLTLISDRCTPWHIAMRRCITALMGCDGIYLLPDWNRSPGATIEKELADKLGMPIIIIPTTKP